MSTIVVIVAAAVVLALAALALRTMTRRRHLRERFGPEYERTVEAKHGRGAADRDLKAREERHEALEIRPLSSTVRDRCAGTRPGCRTASTVLTRPWVRRTDS
ncbi:hypothetical protein ACWKT5_26290 [Streptomyces avermitilis]